MLLLVPIENLFRHNSIKVDQISIYLRNSIMLNQLRRVSRLANQFEYKTTSNQCERNKTESLHK